MTSQHLKDSLARHRTDSAVDLHLKPPIGKLLDPDLCRMVQEDIQRWSDGEGWEIQQATPALGPNLPDRSGVYMFVWKPPFTFQVASPKPQHPLWYALYVGEAGGDGGRNTIRDRYTGEYRRYVQKDHEHLWGQTPQNRASRLGCFLCLEDLEYWFILVNDPTHTRALERRLIDLLNPPLNARGGLKVAGKSPAF